MTLTGCAARSMRVDGTLVETSWDAAFRRIDELVGGYLRTHPRDTLATYVGNPSAHNLSLMLYGPQLVRAVGTRNIYTSSSVDTNPLLAVHALLYGDSYAIPVPDLDRTDHLIIFGGNPLVSNGSIMSAPNMKARLQRIQDRGGRVVVVDPRRTETAAVADEHIFVRPGTDLWVLAAMVRHVIATGAVDQSFVDRCADGVDAVARMVDPFSFDAAAARCGVPATTVRQLADDLVAAPSAAVYGRMGTSTQRFGSACSWLIACLNVLTGNVDRPGGVMFPLSASVYRPPRTPASEHRDRWHSRVRGLGELLGELPAITLAEDILTPGPGRIRGLVTVAGNPAVSVPGSVAMREALAELELMISIDSYVNETTRHADVILPGESPFERPHFPFLTRFAVRNVVQWSDPVLPPESDRPREWEALLRVAAAFEQRTDIDVDERRRRRIRRARRRRGARPALARARARPRRDLPPGRACTRAGAAHRLPLPRRPVRGRVRRRSRRAQHRKAPPPPTRHRPRTAPATARRRRRHPVGPDRAGPPGARRGARAGPGRAAAIGRLPAPGQPSVPALEQQLDAQHPQAGERPATLHTVDPPGRRRRQRRCRR